MLIDKIITTQIDTKDTSLLYATDIDQMLKEELTKRFKGICFQKCYINEVTKILKHSPMILNHHRNEGAGLISIKFQVKATIYDEGEIIPDAEIIQILENGNMILKTSLATIMLMYNVKLQNWKSKDIVPVRVLRTKYKPGKKSISVQAVPFSIISSQDQIDDVYFYNSTLKHDTHIVDMEIKDEMKILDEMEKKTRTIWTKLLFENSAKPPDGMHKIEFTNLKESGMIWRPLCMDPTDFSCYFKKDFTSVELAKQLEKHEKTEDIIISYKMQILKDLKMINVMNATYNLSEKKSFHWMGIL